MFIQKVTWQTNFIGNLNGDGQTTMFFIIEEVKETKEYWKFILLSYNISVK